MAVENQNHWQAFLKLIQVRQPRFYEHVKSAHLKDVTKYNLILMAQNTEDLKEIEVGLRVYHDKIEEYTSLIFGQPRGIKTELVSPEEYEAVESVESDEQTAPVVPPALTPVTADQNELLKILESSIRQKVEGELRASIQKEMESGAGNSQILQRLREDLQEEEQNRRLAVRMALMAEGDQSISRLVMAWQQAKQTGDGGPPWNDVKQSLLELLDTTVQLIQS